MAKRAWRAESANVYRRGDGWAVYYDDETAAWWVTSPKMVISGPFRMPEEAMAAVGREHPLRRDEGAKL